MIKKAIKQLLYIFISGTWPVVAGTGLDEGEVQEKMVIEFSESSENDLWRIINDGVMGGISQSEMVLSGQGTALFRGNVSLENNGGFASVRTAVKEFEFKDYGGVAIRVKGDGKTYQFRLRTDGRFDGISYRHIFETEAGSWITVNIPFDAFEPVFRGRVLSNVKALDPENIRQIGFLIAGKQQGKFNLEIESIKAYK